MIRAANGLRLVKAVHTLVWAVFAGAILAIPLAAWAGSLGWAALLIGFVLLEVAVLGCNQGRCPLTDVAAQLTEDRSPNFDIYLPRVLAQWNKALFGAIYLAAALYTLWRWWQTHAR